MGVNYVIPNISWTELQQTLHKHTEFTLTETRDEIRIQLNLGTEGQHYALQKRIALGRFTGIPPDNIQQGTSRAQIFLNKTEDTDNAWLTGQAVSITQPELILDTIADILDCDWYSEHDDMYEILAGWDNE